MKVATDTRLYRYANRAQGQFYGEMRTGKDLVLGCVLTTAPWLLLVALGGTVSLALGRASLHLAGIEGLESGLGGVASLGLGAVLSGVLLLGVRLLWRIAGRVDIVDADESAR